MERTTYMRVIPRDFFNEAKLLKCMGRIALFAHDQTFKDVKVRVLPEDGSRFRVEQDNSNGALYVANYYVFINGKEYPMLLPYNSRDNYQLYFEGEHDSVRVFDEEGNVTSEFYEEFA